MTAPFVIGSVVTAKAVQILFFATVASKLRKKTKKRKEFDQTWKLTQFLEESKFVK